MAIYNGDNYTKQYVTKPAEKIGMGEVTGKKRFLLEKKTLSFAAQVGDEILGGYIPANSIVTGAKVKIDKSLGVTGIFSLGFKANGVDVEDDNAFVLAADAGGAAALQYAEAGAVGIHKAFSKETQVFLKCSEVMDGTVLDAIVSFEIEYVND